MRKTLLGATSIVALALSAQVSQAQAPDRGADGGGGAQREAGPRPQGGGGGRDPAQRGAERGTQAQGGAGEARSKQPSPSEGTRAAEDGGKGGEEKGASTRTGEKRDGATDKTSGEAKKTGDAKKTGETTRRDETERTKTGDSQKDKDATRERQAEGGRKDEKERSQTGEAAGDTQKQREEARTGERERKAGEPEDRKEVNREQAQEEARKVREKVSANERQQARDAFRRTEVRRARDVDVRVDVGIVLPSRVALYDLPPTIIEVAPAYRGYRYVVVEDEIVIVDPETYVVVDVIEYGGGQTAATGVGGGEAGSARLVLSEREERFIRDHIDRDRRADIDVEVSIGADIPGTIELYSFPDVVVSEVPKVREYRYVVVDEGVVIVDPREQDVVYLIGS